MEAVTFQGLVGDFPIGVVRATHKYLKQNILILKRILLGNITHLIPGFLVTKKILI